MALFYTAFLFFVTAVSAAANSPARVVPSVAKAETTFANQKHWLGFQPRDLLDASSVPALDLTTTAAPPSSSLVTTASSSEYRPHHPFGARIRPSPIARSNKAGMVKSFATVPTIQPTSYQRQQRGSLNTIFNSPIEQRIDDVLKTTRTDCHVGINAGARYTYFALVHEDGRLYASPLNSSAVTLLYFETQWHITYPDRARKALFSDQEKTEQCPTGHCLSESIPGTKDLKLKHVMSHEIEEYRREDERGDKCGWLQIGDSIWYGATDLGTIGYYADGALPSREVLNFARLRIRRVYPGLEIGVLLGTIGTLFFLCKMCQLIVHVCAAMGKLCFLVCGGARVDARSIRSGFRALCVGPIRWYDCAVMCFFTDRSREVMRTNGEFGGEVEMEELSPVVCRQGHVGCSGYPEECARFPSRPPHSVNDAGIAADSTHLELPSYEEAMMTPPAYLWIHVSRVA